MNDKDKEQHIRKNWFSDHKATLTEHGDLKVLTWKEPGTFTYYVRYVFDGYRMYVSGDTGEAVFLFTEESDVHTVSSYDLYYFERKLQAYHEERRDFNSDKAVKRLREWLKSLKECECKYDQDDMKEFFEEARNCSSHSEWAHIINSHDWISALDCDYWEWMYKAGDEIPWRIHGYLVGLKMASEQLKAMEAIA